MLSINNPINQVM